MKNVLIVVGFIILVGIMGRLECQDEIRSAEYDKQIKQEVIKDWQIRCATGDIFDEQICKAVMK